MKRDEWVRVKSESELRPGMAVQLRNCLWCGKRETQTIVRIKPSSGYCVNPVGVMRETNSTIGFVGVGNCRGERSQAFDNAIREGRLYRLADWQFDEASDETTAPAKVLVGVEERR